MNKANQFLLSNEQIAQLCHEANKAYCESIGDMSQPEWEDAPQWQKDSAILGVESVIANPKTTPEQSHISWLNHKQSEGWVYGPEKDPAAKTHPCMVPYEQLPTSQRIKDYIFITVVNSCLRMNHRMKTGKW